MKNNIDELRKRKNLKIQQLADIIGVSREHLNNVKNGKKPFTQNMLVKLAKALDCRPSDIISDEDMKSNIVQEVNKEAIIAATVAVIKAANEFGINLSDEQIIAAATMLYNRTTYFQEPPTKSTALTIIELIERDEEHGGGIQRETP